MFLYSRRAHRKQSQQRTIDRLEARVLLAAVPTPTPFYGTPFTVGEVIQAEDYDKGGEGVAYHDTTAANTGNGNYRTTEGVDIGKLGSNGHDVGYCYPGEWMDYTVNVVSAGTFTLSAAVANRAAGGAFHLEFSGVNKTGTLAVPNTGAWATFQTITSSAFTLPAGTQVMRVVLDRAGAAMGVANFDFFKLNAVPQPPPNTGPITLHWKSAAAAPIPRMEGAAITVNGKLYVFGGYQYSRPHWLAATEADAYDPVTNTWTKLATQPAALTHQGIATDGRYVYLAGGYISHPNGSQTFGTTQVWRYDTQTNTWTQFVPLPAARSAGSLVLIGRTLHFVSGTDVNLIGRTDHWMLNLDDAQPKWVASTPIPSPRNHAATVVLNGKMYIIGGQAGSNDGAPEADVFVWDPAHPTVWTHAASLPGKMSHEAAVVINGKIVTICGYTPGKKLLALVQQYDPATDKWTALTSYPMALASPMADVVGNKLVVTGGGIYNLLQTTTYVSALS